MSANVKKIVTWAIVAFVAFYLCSQPQGAGNAVRGAVDLLQQAADSVVIFFQSLAN